MATIDKFFPKRRKVIDDDQQQKAHPYTLLNTLIRRMREHDGIVYKAALDRGDETFEKEVSAFLRPEIIALYESGKLFELEDLRKLSQKDNFRHRNSSAYLHVVVTPEGVRFYVGQANDTQQRVMSQHQSETYRRNNPSLHYMAMENCIEDFFVNLGLLRDARDGEDDKILSQDLNTFEMWGALIFRSLAPQILRKYLPPSIVNDDVPDIHLNVRSPLAQWGSFGIEAWHADMKVSTDPLKQKWYSKFIEGRSLELQKVADRQRTRVREGANLGTRRSVCSGKQGTRLMHRGVYITVPHAIKKYEDGTVHFKTELHPEGEGDHPHYYARNAPSTDICRRLGIQFTGLGADGRELSMWARTEVKTDTVFKRANSLCDFILEVPIEVTEVTPRRFLDVNKTRGRPKIVFT
jgi:hypothetical protein